MVIADETDAAAMAKWEHYKAGTDVEALAYRDAQAEDDPKHGPLLRRPNRRRTLGIDKLPTNQGVLVGSYASRSRACWTNSPAVPGVRGVMLTFDDFVIGMEQFGTRITAADAVQERDQGSSVSRLARTAGVTVMAGALSRRRWPAKVR